MASQITDITVAVVGKTGSGKSTLCNVLLRSDHFKVASAATHQSVQSNSYTQIIDDEYRLTVIDTPDALTMSDDAQKLQQEADNFINLCRNGLQAILLVVECGRFTQESRQAVEAMAAMFGEHVYDFIIIVFTKADDFDSAEELMNHLEQTRCTNPDLDSVLRRCGNRVAHIDNGKRCDKKLQQEQVKEILDLVVKMVKVNMIDNKQYTMQMFQEARINLQKQLRENEVLHRMRQQQQERQTTADEVQLQESFSERTDQSLRSGSSQGITDGQLEDPDLVLFRKLRADNQNLLNENIKLKAEKKYYNIHMCRIL